MRYIAQKGRFFGVPFLLKDLLYEYAGEPLSMGSRSVRVIPKHDNTIVKRIKQAGLNCFGKTNTSEFGLIITTEPKAFGATHNPFKHGYSTGGSSGGSAAAVASGIVPMAASGDGGSSIRFPAAWYGVFGIKPTRGRNPISSPLGEDWLGAVANHVITRTVRDSAMMLDVLSGAEIGAPFVLPSDIFYQASQMPPKRLKSPCTNALWSPIHRLMTMSWTAFIRPSSDLPIWGISSKKLSLMWI